MNFCISFQSALKELLVPGEPCVLVDFPNHANVGDSAIWLGEILNLHEIGIRPRVSFDIFSVSVDDIIQNIGDNTILIHGGGNFGDLWERHQKFRERLCVEFPHNRIIQLPQSIYFQDKKNLHLSQEVFLRHTDFHLLVRDRPSFKIALNFAPDRSYLVPDAAFCLPRKLRGSKNRRFDMLVLFRTDAETINSDNDMIKLPEGVSANFTDWVAESKGFWHRYFGVLQKLIRRNKLFSLPLLNFVFCEAAHKLAKCRFNRGVNLVTEARVVVTDRLHAVILSWLYCIPVFYIDNSYGKLSGVLDCWLSDEIGISRCDSHKEALKKATEWLNGELNCGSVDCSAK